MFTLKNLLLACALALCAATVNVHEGTKCSNGMLWTNDEALVTHDKVLAKYPELKGAVV